MRMQSLCSVLAACCLAFGTLSAPLLAAPPSTEGEKPAPYDEKVEGRELVDAALAKAKASNKRVLIQWGGNWCSWCHVMHRMLKTDPKVKQKLLYEYELVLVDIGSWKEPRNADLAEKYGAKFADDGVPYLTVLSADGEVIVNQESEFFELKQAAQPGDDNWVQAHDPEKMLKFLTTHQAPPQNAATVLAAAQERAKASKKPLLVRFGAPWCGWCNRFDAWFNHPQVSKVMNGRVELLKIDIERMTGGNDLLSKYRPKGSEGVPWSVMLDADGKVLATSDVDGKNIGFPVTEMDFVAFRSMLKSAGVSISDDEVRALQLAASEQLPKP